MPAASRPPANDRDPDGEAMAGVRKAVAQGHRAGAPPADGGRCGTVGPATGDRTRLDGRFPSPQGRGRIEKTYPLWLFGTSSEAPTGALIRLNKGNGSSRAVQIKGRSVKKIALAVALVVAGLSLGGCFVGKGKAPAPVITKG